MVASEGSVTIWLNRLSEGDAQAAQILWDRVFAQMVRFARSRLDRNGGPKGEEEDAALSAFHDFFRAAADNRFAQLANRNDLWQILHLLVNHKVADYYRRARRQKRDQQPIAPEHDPAAPEGADPALAAGVMDEMRALFDRLPAGVRQVAVLKLEGYTNEEIARQFRCTVRTVERRLGLIRSLWAPVKT